MAAECDQCTANPKDFSSSGNFPSGWHFTRNDLLCHLESKLLVVKLLFYYNSSFSCIQQYVLRNLSLQSPVCPAFTVLYPFRGDTDTSKPPPSILRTFRQKAEDLRKISVFQAFRKACIYCRRSIVYSGRRRASLPASPVSAMLSKARCSTHRILACNSYI